MTNDAKSHIDEETISTAGLRLSDTPVKSVLAIKARMYEFSTLDDVYIMESDFYGNPMPEGSCFMAFKGRHGLLGTDMPLETLRTSSTEDIRMVQSNM